MDILSLIPIQDLGPWAIVGLAVLLVLRGDLVPRKTHADIMQERDTWRVACERKDETIRDLSESAATTAALLRALPSPAPAKPENTSEK